MLGTEEITIEHNPTSPDSIGVDPLETSGVQVGVDPLKLVEYR